MVKIGQGSVIGGAPSVQHGTFAGEVGHIDPKKMLAIEASPLPSPQVGVLLGQLPGVTRLADELRLGSLPSGQFPSPFGAKADVVMIRKVLGKDTGKNLRNLLDMTQKSGPEISTQEKTYLQILAKKITKKLGVLSDHLNLCDEVYNKQISLKEG